MRDAAWPIIANPEAIAIDQAWAGANGEPFNESNVTTSVDRWTHGVPLWQCLTKPLPNGSVAVLMVKYGNSTLDLDFSFASVPSGGCSRCAVRDVWERQALGSFAEG